jgi:glucokinase
MRKLIGEAHEKFTDEFEDIVAPGFGAAGLISLEGYAFYSPNVPAFNGGAALLEDLTKDLDIPVVIDNDNNCSAFAESQFGSAAGKNNVLVVGLGTGIGGAYILDGKVLRGAHGFAGELGHFVVQENGPKCACGKNGCYEALASGLRENS